MRNGKLVRKLISAGMRLDAQLSGAQANTEAIRA
jgi:hypothetical protein